MKRNLNEALAVVRDALEFPHGRVERLLARLEKEVEAHLRAGAKDRAVSAVNVARADINLILGTFANDLLGTSMLGRRK